MSICTNNIKETKILLYTDVKSCNSESFLILSVMRATFKKKYITELLKKCASFLWFQFGSFEWLYLLKRFMFI